jgi:CBS domain-containing protein
MKTKKKANASKRARVAQVMQPEVVCVGQAESLERAAQVLWDRDCGCVPVVDAEGVAVGLLTDRDIAMSAFIRGDALRRIPVASVMSGLVHACRADDALELAHELLQRHQVHRLPVLDEAGRPIGLLSLTDLARAARRRSEHERVGETFARVHAPRAAPLETERAQPTELAVALEPAPRRPAKKPEAAAKARGKSARMQLVASPPAEARGRRRRRTR